MELNFLNSVVLINIFSVKAFEKLSFVITDQSHTIIVFIIFGIMMIFGILGGHTYGF